MRILFLKWEILKIKYYIVRILSIFYFFIKKKKKRKTFITAFTDIDFVVNIFARDNYTCFILYGTVFFSKEYYVFFNLLN